MPEEFKWKTFVARPVEVEAYQAKTRTMIQQKPGERTTGLVYAQIGAWIIKSPDEFGHHTLLGEEEFKALYQPAKKGEGVKAVETKEEGKSDAVDPKALDVKA